MSAKTIQRFVYLDDKTEFLTVERIPNISAMAVCPNDIALSTSEKKEALRAVFFEHKAKLEQAIKKGMVKPLASRDNPQFSGGDASLVKRAQFSKFFASLGIGIKPILTFTTLARPLCVDPALLALDTNANIYLINKVGTNNCNSNCTAGEYRVEIEARIARQAEGFFTLDEAAQLLADENNQPVKAMICEMRKAEVKNKGTDKLQPLTRDGNRFPIDTTGQKFADYGTLVAVVDIVIWLKGSGTNYRWPATPAESKPESETPAQRRKNHDMTKERGTKALILEHWEAIEKLHPQGVNGRQVRKFLKARADPSDKDFTQKTVQNHLSVLRSEGLIP